MAEPNEQKKTQDESVWAILELMGHVKTGALISKDTQFGTALLRAEVPQQDGSFVTQLINPSSLYRVTICEEKLARACANVSASQPMHSWELRHLLPSPTQDENTGSVNFRKEEEEELYE